MKSKFLVCFTIIFLAISIIPITVFANSAQPPALVIIMKNAPEDAKISIMTQDGLKEISKKDVAWETYFVFYSSDIGNSKEIMLKISGNDTEYEQKVESKYLQHYDNIITFDFNSHSITEGKLLSRSILLVGLRVILTLIIEGAVFLLFGYRKKHSWIVFLIMNLITQGWLNIMLNSGSPLGTSVVFKLIMMEFLIFIVEIIIVLAALKEHGKGRRVAYVLIANFLSLILGGLLITVLPI